MGSPLGIFLLGGPGSGKDYVLTHIFSKFDLTEVQADQLINGAAKKLVENAKNLVINGISDSSKIDQIQRILQENAYQCSYVHVSVTNKVSRLRNEQRNLPLNESKRIEKFLKAEKLAESTKAFVFNNSINLNQSTEMERLFFANQIEKLLEHLISLGLEMRSSPIIQEKVKKPTGNLKDACWSGYTAVGMKTKNGRKVPNCVPVKEAVEAKLKTPHTIENIAKKHGVDPSHIEKAVAAGIKVEKEHTNDASAAEVIALAHLWERPDYYKMLSKVENQPIKEDINLLFEMQFVGTDEYREHAISMTPGQDQDIEDIFAEMQPSSAESCGCDDCDSCNKTKTLREFKGEIQTANVKPTLKKRRVGTGSTPNGFMNSNVGGMPVLTAGAGLPEAVEYHMQNGISLVENVFRPGSEMFFAMISEAKRLYAEGQYQPKDEWEKDLLESDVGETAIYEGREVILDYPFEESEMVSPRIIKQSLLEYLTPKQSDKYSKIEMTPKARRQTDHFFGKNNDRVEEDVINDTPDKSEVHKAVENHIGKPLTHDEYRTGRTTDKYGREVKLGRLIKDPKLQSQFASDNTRAGAKAIKSMRVSIHRGTEVAGQTNPTPDETHPSGHSWAQQSCKNVEDGEHKRYLNKEIEHGTVVVFGHDHDGKEVYRATLQPHHNDKGHVTYAVNSEYGIKNSAFTAHAHNVAERLSGEHKGGRAMYAIHPSVYDDRGVKFMLHPTASREDVVKALNSKRESDQIAAYNHPKITAEDLSKGIKNFDQNAIESPYLNEKHLSEMIKSGNASYAVQHPNLTPNHIEEIMAGKGNVYIKMDAIRHPKATSEQISKALKHRDPSIRQAAIENPKATPEHISKALGDRNIYTRLAAIQHPNVNVENISQALNDKDSSMRFWAIENPKVTPEHISKALDDRDADVAHSAAQHPNANAENITKALKSRHDFIRENAIAHPKVTPEHISQVLDNDEENIDIQLAALKHPNASAENIAKGLNHKIPQIRQLAKKIYKKQNAKPLKEESGAVSFRTFKHSLLEYLTPKQSAKYSEVKMSNVARKNTDHFFGENNDRVEEDLIDHTPDKSEVHKAVENHIGKPLTHEEYKSGKTSDKYGREVKLSKLIKDPNLQKQFASDNTRAGVKAVSKPKMSIVRGTEVAGQTNPTPDETHPSGHSWAEQSCKNVVDGSNRHYLRDEIKQGTVVVFGHDHDGKEIYRATLHPHEIFGEPEKGTVYGLNSEYGIKHPAFTAHAHNVAERLSNATDTNEVYSIKDDVYNDKPYNTILHPKATSSRIFRYLESGHNSNKLVALRHPKVTPEHITYALNDKNWNIRRAAIEHPNATSEHITQALKDEDYRVKAAAIGHRNVTSEHVTQALKDKDSVMRQHALNAISKVTPEHISTALKDEDSFVRMGAASHPNVTSDHITQALKDENPLVRRSAIENPKATSEHVSIALNDKDPKVVGSALARRNMTPDHITQALKHENPMVRRSAIEHPNATSEHITRALNDKDPLVRGAAIIHPNITEDHITQALKDEDPVIRRAAIIHPKSTSEHITQALKDEDLNVRIAAIGRGRHQKITPEHISTALKDKNSRVRFLAINQPKATSEHITQALNDEDSIVRRNAIEHPNVTSEHITQALNDEDSDVRQSAIRNEKVTSEHITQALKDENPYVRTDAILYHKHKNSKVTPEHISMALKDSNSNTRLEALHHLSATPEHIAQALNDENPTIRMYAERLSRQLAEESSDPTKGKGIGKPWREGGGGAVYVRTGDGGVKKVSFSKSGMTKKFNDPARVRSFVARHRCLTNKDKTSASYWACRWPRFFSNSGKVWW